MTDKVEPVKFNPRTILAIIQKDTGEVMDVAMPGTPGMFTIRSLEKGYPEEYRVIPVTITPEGE